LILLGYATDTDPKAVKKFLAQHNSEEILNTRNNAGNTPLIMATITTREPLGRDVVTQLLDAGASINLKNKSGSTALHSASKKNYSSIVQLLLKRGADFRMFNDDGMLPVQLATDRDVITVLDEAERFKAAEERAAEVVIQGTRILSFVKSGNSEAIRRIAVGDKPVWIEAFDYVENKGDKPAIHLAFDSNQFDLLKALLESGANPDIISQDGKGQSILRF